MRDDEQSLSELYRVFLACETEDDVRALLLDLCTFSEAEQMAQRVSAARMLIGGNTYAAIIEKTGISSATLSRVSRCISHGSGGYTKLIPKSEKK